METPAPQIQFHFARQPRGQMVMPRQDPRLEPVVHGSHGLLVGDDGGGGGQGSGQHGFQLFQVKLPSGGGTGAGVFDGEDLPKCFVATFCESVEVWKCGSVEVWKCESVEVWQCRSVEV